VTEAVISKISAGEPEKLEIPVVKPAKPVTSEKATYSSVTEVVDKETTQQDNVESKELAISTELPKTSDETETSVLLLPKQNEIKHSQIVNTDAGEEQALRVTSEDTNSKMTTTPGITESTHTNLGLADIVTGKFMEATTSTASREPTISTTTLGTTITTKTSTNSAIITTGPTTTAPMTSTATTTTTTVTTMEAAARSTITTKNTKAATATTPIPTVFTSTTKKPSSSSSSEETLTGMAISKMKGTVEVEMKATPTLEETSTENKNIVKDQKLEYKTNVLDIFSTSQPAAFFEADLQTTQSPDITDVTELSGSVTTQNKVFKEEPERQMSQPESVLLKSDAIVFPTETETKKPTFEITTLQSFAETEKASEGSKRTEKARPRAIQAIEEPNTSQ